MSNQEIKEALATIREEWEFFRYPQGGIEIFEKDSRAIMCVTHPTEASGRFDGSIIAKFPTWLASQATLIDQQEQEIERLKEGAHLNFLQAVTIHGDKERAKSSLELAVKALEEINSGKGEFSAVYCRIIARKALDQIRRIET